MAHTCATQGRGSDLSMFLAVSTLRKASSNCRLYMERKLASSVDSISLARTPCWACMDVHSAPIATSVIKHKQLCWPALRCKSCLRSLSEMQESLHQKV